MVRVVGFYVGKNTDKETKDQVFSGRFKMMASSNTHMAPQKVRRIFKRSNSRGAKNIMEE
jgi:hypothetical protein